VIVNPYIWYAERELTHVPPHFIKCPTPVSDDSKFWIINKTSGRYAFNVAMTNNVQELLLDVIYVHFENSSDATLYELIWAGKNG
jgi:hypothetical protein